MYINACPKELLTHHPSITPPTPPPPPSLPPSPPHSPPPNPIPIPIPPHQVKADYDWGEARLDAIEQLAGTKELPLVYVGGQLVGGPERECFFGFGFWLWFCFLNFVRPPSADQPTNHRVAHSECAAHPTELNATLILTD